MNGGFARSGFRYQDLYLLHRLLGHARDVCRDAWALGTSDLLAMMDRCTTKFGIEAAVTSELGQPPWDVTIAIAALTEVTEVKSGAIDKTDREALWRRLRRTAASADRAKSLTPVLVVDPETGGSLQKWDELASVARDVREVPPARAVVHTARDLVDESLHRLCNAEADPTCEPIIRLLFPDGITDALRRNIRDWLDERGANSNRTPATFTLGEMFRALGMAREAMALAKGTLQKWRSQWQDWRALAVRNAPGTFGARVRPFPLRKRNLKSRQRSPAAAQGPYC